MPDYSFTTLSPKEFESLSRDLLQAELGIRLETFTSGRDDGIDGRWSDGLIETIIIQCKHYAGSGYRKLLRSLSTEAKKVKSQKQLRYILTTSVGLTPANKDEIFQMLYPYCHATSDIYGRDDLNNLLSLHPQIEQQNFKLWLTSEAVLSRMLNAAILNDTAFTLEKAQKRVQRYVQNNSYQRAIKILEQSRFCIVTGIPGIGKTTLAEVLLTHYVDKLNYNAFRIREDISEIKSIRKHDQKQIFYYDDFLGTTTLDSLRKNEDKRIVDFVEDVYNNKNWRLIVTTREYILRSAEFQYESLSQFPFDINTCIISLDDYTDSVRAEILYNHLYFSDIPTEYKLSILHDNNYEKILTHKNYNPRIIEYMTSFIRLGKTSSDTYFDIFLSNLDNQKDIWKHTFERQISLSSKHLLLVLVSMPESIFLEHLKIAFLSFHSYRRQLHNFDTNESNFSDALKLLDGNFIKTDRAKSFDRNEKTIISFHNPSVRDFLQAHLAEYEDDVYDLIKSAVYFEQYEVLWIAHKGSQIYSEEKKSFSNSKFSGIINNHSDFLEGIQKTLDAKSCRLRHYSFYKNTEAEYGVYIPTFEERLLFLLNVTSQIKTSLAKSIAISTINKYKKILQKQANINKEELVKIVSRLKSVGIPGESSKGELYQLTRNIIVAQLEDISDYEALTLFLKTFREDFVHQELIEIQLQFEKFCVDEVDTLIFNKFNGVEFLEDSAYSLREITESLEMSEPSCIQKIDQEIIEMKEELENEDDEKENTNLKEENIVDEYQLTFSEITNMFNRLLLDIEEPQIN